MRGRPQKNRQIAARMLMDQEHVRRVLQARAPSFAIEAQTEGQSPRRRALMDARDHDVEPMRWKKQRQQVSGCVSSLASALSRPFSRVCSVVSECCTLLYGMHSETAYHALPRTTSVRLNVVLTSLGADWLY